MCTTLVIVHMYICICNKQLTFRRGNPMFKQTSAHTYTINIYLIYEIRSGHESQSYHHYSTQNNMRMNERTWRGWNMLTSINRTVRRRGRFILRLAEVSCSCKVEPMTFSMTWETTQTVHIYIYIYWGHVCIEVGQL